MGKLILFLGGARSGKSSTAERLAARMGERVLYIATATAFDDEMRERIRSHRDSRPDTWETLEAPTGVGKAAGERQASADVVLLDCLTLLLNNLYIDIDTDPDHPDEAAFTAALEQETVELIEAIRSSDAPWIVVSNEVGLGVVPPYPLGRQYRDGLGRLNRRLAEIANEVYFMIAGMAVPLHEIALNLDAPGAMFENDKSW